jgi:hypothetical protein
MIFYTIKNGGRVIDWAGTQADARTATKSHASAHAGDTITWDEHDVPTDKPTLLAWLKANALGEIRAVKNAELNRPTSSPQTASSFSQE